MEQKAKDAAWKVRFLRDSLCCFTMAVGYDETSPDSGLLTNTHLGNGVFLSVDYPP